MLIASLSFTAHFLHNGNRRKVVLSVMELDSDHNSDYLASKLTEAISARQLEGKIHVGVRDNAANMICAMYIVHRMDHRCQLHGSHTSVGDT